MSKIYKSQTELVGKTPLMEAVNFEKKLGLKARLLVKIEFFNPGGSVKDRIAAEMISAAEKEGKLSAGGVIVEPTSGNTGIGIAAAGAAMWTPRRYRLSPKNSSDKASSTSSVSASSIEKTLRWVRSRLPVSSIRES